MNITRVIFTCTLLLSIAATSAKAGETPLYRPVRQTDTTYLARIIQELEKKWPDNRNINLVFHGHSVPSGYFKTPTVNTFGSYPLLVLQKLTNKYPRAVVNAIKTCIGGENSEQGAKRFEKDVLSHRPDVLFIDYALNDRPIGLERAKSAWESMIVKALELKIKVILLTPTPDLGEDILDDRSKLAQHTRQIVALGAKYQIPVVDAYTAFKSLKKSKGSIADYMAQNNHINEKGHEVVASLIARVFFQ